MTYITRYYEIYIRTYNATYHIIIYHILHLQSFFWVHTSYKHTLKGPCFFLFRANSEERLVLIRPLREEARLPKLPAIPVEGLKAPALACGSSRGNVGRPFFEVVFFRKFSSDIFRETRKKKHGLPFTWSLEGFSSWDGETFLTNLRLFGCWNMMIQMITMAAVANCYPDFEPKRHNMCPHNSTHIITGIYDAYMIYIIYIYTYMIIHVHILIGKAWHWPQAWNLFSDIGMLPRFLFGIVRKEDTL